MVLENSFNKLIKARHGTLLYNKNDIYIGKSIEKYGEFSYLEAKIFEQICKAGDVVIEVGANIGAHTLYLSKLVGNGYVFAFEPQRLVFQNLCANLALNSISNVFAYQEAVSNENGTIIIPECNFKENNNLFSESNQFQIRGMAVLEAFQGKGFGAELVKEAENHCINLNADLIWFNARENSVPFYKKLDYKIIGDSFLIPDVGIHFAMYKKMHREDFQ